MTKQAVWLGWHQWFQILYF